MPRNPQDAQASRSESNASNSEPSAGSETSGEYLPNDPDQLFAKLKEALSRLIKGSLTADAEENAARYIATLLRHAYTLVWRDVARGDLDSPGRILGFLQQLQRFVDRHTPALPPKSQAAVEIQSALTAFFIAHESLAEVRVKVRLADRERSEAEREVLRALAESEESYLRRGQVLDRLRPRKQISPARVSQVLVQLTSEGLLKRIQATAQGNAETAYYGLSPLGHDLVEELDLVEVATPEYHTAALSDDSRSRLLKVLKVVIATALDPILSKETGRLARGLLMNSGSVVAPSQQSELANGIIQIISGLNDPQANKVAADIRSALNVIHQHQLANGERDTTSTLLAAFDKASVGKELEEGPPFPQEQEGFKIEIDHKLD